MLLGLLEGNIKCLKTLINIEINMKAKDAPKGVMTFVYFQDYYQNLKIQKLNWFILTPL